MYSPCRDGKGHHCSRAHAELVEGFRCWRESEYARAESETYAYDTELSDYWQTHARPTFRAYLEGMRQSHV
jgi:hypothetical protein